MTRPRSQQVALEATPYYHCISRCVRRAFLCGEDHFSGRSYEHRKAWVVERMAQLAEVFAIDLCAYAVMSNHYHLVVRINAEEASEWSLEEVAERWMRLFSGVPLVKNWLAGTMTGKAEELRCQEIIEDWRAKLHDLSWFMRCLNEHIARKANQEDVCTGRFWEGRFKSQALLDEAAVLSCMAYVDLNPIRAGVTDLPENSDHTSVQQRIVEQSDARKGAALSRGAKPKAAKSGDQPHRPTLMPFVDASNAEQLDRQAICDYRLMDYLELVDWTGRALREDKRGAIPEAVPTILTRLDIDRDTWLRHMRPRRNRMLAAVGALDKLKAYVAATGRKWLIGRQEAAALSPG